MRLPEFVLRFLRRKPPDRLSFHAEAEALRSLEQLARREKRSPEALAAKLLAKRLAERLTAESCLERWDRLTPRQREVARLILQGYDNRQIGTRMDISPDTVKTHTSHLLAKLGLPSREALRAAMKGKTVDGRPRTADRGGSLTRDERRSMTKDE